jgi:transcriptional regulator with XRE-family HTH domain
MRDEEHARRLAAGRWVRDARVRRGFQHQTELAQALNVHPSLVSGIERGHAPVSVEVAQRLAGVLHMPLLEVWRSVGLPLPPGIPDDQLGDYPLARHNLKDHEYDALIAVLRALRGEDAAAILAGQDAADEPEPSDPRRRGVAG